MKAKECKKCAGGKCKCGEPGKKAPAGKPSPKAPYPFKPKPKK